MFKRQVDMRSQPVKKVVALGESTTWGFTVSSKEKCWVNQVVAMLEEFQGSQIELVNQGIGSNVITTECPSYQYSNGPAALDRVDAEVIAHNPDLVFLSYGLNDARGGTTPEVFRRAFQQLVDRVRAKIDPLIVVPNVYYMHEAFYDDCERWTSSSYEVTETFNLVIEQLAGANGLIFADIYSAEVGCDWMIDNDHCHANDLGHRIIANEVFKAIARNCTFVAARMPEQSICGEFADKYGFGPEQPAAERK